MGIQVSHGNGAVITGQWAGSSGQKVLSLIGFPRSNGWPVNIEKVQGFGTEETYSARLCRVVYQGQPSLRQRVKLEAGSQVQGDIAALRASRRCSSSGAPSDDWGLESRYSRRRLAELAFLYCQDVRSRREEPAPELRQFRTEPLSVPAEDLQAASDITVAVVSPVLLSLCEAECLAG